MRQSKLIIAILLSLLPSGLAGQDAKPFAIADNSFLVEEAFNQEKGIFQNILFVQRSKDGLYNFQFTQEWPVGGIRHQLSYTVPLDVQGSRATRGTVALNYRLQALEETASQPAFSPRLSMLLPTAPDGEFGLQTNMPLSKQFGDVYLHFNAGYTLSTFDNGLGDGQPSLAGSTILRVKPMFHLMAESVYLPSANGSFSSWVVSPGFRGGWNIGDKQLIVGAAVPIGLLTSDDSYALITYFSYELPFGSR